MRKARAQDPVAGFCKTFAKNGLGWARDAVFGGVMFGVVW